MFIVMFFYDVRKSSLQTYVSSGSDSSEEEHPLCTLVRSASQNIKLVERAGSIPNTKKLFNLFNRERHAYKALLAAERDSDCKQSFVNICCCLWFNRALYADEPNSIYDAKQRHEKVTAECRAEVENLLNGSETLRRFHDRHIDDESLATIHKDFSGALADDGLNVLSSVKDWLEKVDLNRLRGRRGALDGVMPSPNNFRIK